jgi:Putative zinc-finger
MDHSEAIRIGAAEKYLLGELPAREREEFEEHYFACGECAADVSSGAVFVDNARQVLREVPASQTVLKLAPSRSWASWLRPAWSFAAVLALAVVVGYQNFVTIPGLKQTAAQPEALTSYSLLTAQSRGAGATVVRPSHDQPFGLYVDIPATQSFAYYTVDVTNGSRHFAVKVSPEQAKDTVQVLIPAGALNPGHAEMIITGQNEGAAPVEVARYPFEIQMQ